MKALLDARLAWRAVTGRDAARVSLFVRIIGVAMAALVLLLASTASDALDRRGDRITWRTDWDPYASDVHPGNAWLQVGWDSDYYLEHEISRVRVASYSDEAPVPPGLPRVPEPGEAFVSPALARLIESDPEVLGPRYGNVAGTITDDGLSDPGELVVIMGLQVPESPEFFGFGVLYQELPTGFRDSSVTVFMWVIVTLGVVVLLFPIALFIASAARLNAQESDARLAALRLAGASPSRVRWIVAWESVISAVPGALLGLGLFFLVRPLAAEVDFGGAAFFPSDFALNWMSVLVLFAIPVTVVAASFVGLRDVEISPLGVSRRAARKTVRPIGFAFLIPGFFLLWWALGPQNDSNFGRTVSLVASVLLILIGVALIGTWLGQAVARVLAARTRSGSALLAMRRIVGDPHGSFRTVSGVTFAVFAGTLFLSVSAALEREIEVRNVSGLRDEVIRVNDFRSEPLGTSSLTGAPDGTLEIKLTDGAGIVGDPIEGSYVRVYQGNCDEIARVVPVEGGCDGRIAVRSGTGLAPGDVIDFWGRSQTEPEASVTVPTDIHIFDASGIGAWTPDIILPEGTIEGFDQIASSYTMVVPPSGVAPGDREFEQVRTAVARSYPWATVYYALENDRDTTSGLETLRSLVYAGTFAAFLLSGATAAMAVAGSIIARRHSFALLRMSGVSLGSLRKTVVTEATVPLALVSVVSAATAVAVSALVIARAGQGSVLPPPQFILPLVGGLVVGLLLPLMTLPLLDRVTATDRTRFD